MLLTIDIGNSTVKFGVFDRKNLVNKFLIPTVRHQTGDEILSLVKPNLPEKVSAVAVSSVVPELKNSIENLSKKCFGVAPFFITHDFDIGLKVNYNPPENLGIDRLVAAFAAKEKYGMPAIVCDFGTATTIDAVNSNGEFVGGVIVAGMNLLADALFQKTSKLPKIEIKKAEKVIACSTDDAINAGIYFGYIGLTDGIIKRMIGELNEKPKVVATGGLAQIISDGSEFIEIYDENLMLDGLRLIYERISRKSKT
ncbi:type III pantothenate kinase [soil metagenome]